jgi:hypothetical protein
MKKMNNEEDAKNEEDENEARVKRQARDQESRIQINYNQEAGSWKLKAGSWK